ncbi:MAG: hypothetical protein ACFCU4_01720 [Puniceicoccaceae bacterium]
MQIKDDASLLGGVVAAKRVLRLRDLSSLAGKFLMRYGVRTLLPAAALTFTLLIGNKAMGGGAPKGLPYTPLILSSVLFVTGVVLRILPSLLANRRMLSVEARGFNNLENYRKARVDIWLTSLWERVFQYEARVLYGEDEVKAERAEISGHLKVIGDHFETLPMETQAWMGNPSGEEVAKKLSRMRSMGEGVESTLEGFLIDGHHAVMEPLSESASLIATGYNLSMLLDFLDGAPFRIGDDKLRERYLAHPTLLQARKRQQGGLQLSRCFRKGRLARHSDLAYWIQQINRDIMCGIWRRAVCREVMITTASAIQRLEADYPGVLFTAQSLLRPGDARNPYNNRIPGLSERLEEEAERLVHRVMGNSWKDVEETLDRFAFRSVVRATRLRIGYDPDYLDSSLDQSFATDLKRGQGTEVMIRLANELATKVGKWREELERLDWYKGLTEGERLQARLWLHHRQLAPMEDGTKVLEAIQSVGEAMREELRMVRIHQCLCWIELEEHREMVWTLGRFDRQGGLMDGRRLE